MNCVFEDTKIVLYIYRDLESVSRQIKSTDNSLYQSACIRQRRNRNRCHLTVQMRNR